MIIKDKSICIFSQTLLKAGAEKQAVLLALSLRSKFEVTFIVYYRDKIDSSLMNQLVESGINVLTLKGNHLKKLYKIFKTFNKNTILFNYLFLPNFIGGILSKLKRVHCTFGGIRSSKLSKKKFFLEKLLHNNLNDYTIFNNVSGMDNCIDMGFLKHKSIYIPNALFPIPKKKVKVKSEGFFNILSVGRFEEVKNYPFALSVIAELIKNKIKIKYTIIGWGSKEKEIRKIISDLDISDYVEIIINPPNINDFYERADLFFQCSKQEGVSNTILEAMSHTLPVVATKVGDNDKLVINNKNGYIINEGELNVFREKIHGLIDNHEKRINFGSSAYDRLKREYSIDNFEERYNKLVLSI